MYNKGKRTFVFKEGKETRTLKRGSFIEIKDKEVERKLLADYPRELALFKEEVQQAKEVTSLKSKNKLLKKENEKLIKELEELKAKKAG